MALARTWVWLSTITFSIHWQCVSFGTLGRAWSIHLIHISNRIAAVLHNHYVWRHTPTPGSKEEKCWNKWTTLLSATNADLILEQSSRDGILWDLKGNSGIVELNRRACIWKNWRQENSAGKGESLERSSYWSRESKGRDKGLKREETGFKWRDS